MNESKNIYKWKGKNKKKTFRAKNLCLRIIFCFLYLFSIFSCPIELKFYFKSPIHTGNILYNLLAVEVVKDFFSIRQ